MPCDHPLVGTWITQEEDSNVAFVFSVADNQFRISGFCISSGEEFQISEVTWDGEALGFVALFASTETITRNVFRIRSDGAAELALTTFETWKKRDVKPGDLPEAWKSS